MATRLLSVLIASLLAGCTSERLVRDNIVPECPGSADRAISRAAACMTAAFYEIAMEEGETSADGSAERHDVGEGKARKE